MASTSAPVTLVRNVEPIAGQNAGVYAVLPKDTLYSISRRASALFSIFFLFVHKISA